MSQVLDDLLFEHPFWFVLAAVGCAALCGIVMYIAVAVHATRLRPQMSDRQKPLFFRYSWAFGRFMFTIGFWTAIGLAAGFSGALLFAILDVYPTLPYGYFGFAVATCLGAGIGGLMALKLGQRQAAS